MARRARLGLGLLGALLLAAGARAESVACHVTYGGATQIIEARPVDSPYGVTPTAIGSFFLFRIVFRREPADLASISSTPMPTATAGRPCSIKPATPTRRAMARSTALAAGMPFMNRCVTRLQYWCELKMAAGK